MNLNVPAVVTLYQVRGTTPNYAQRIKEVTEQNNARLVCYDEA